MAASYFSRHEYYFFSLIMKWRWSPRINFPENLLSTVYSGLITVRVKGGMILWNGMWHGLRNDIIMWNLICGKWRKEKNSTGKYVRVSAALCFCANSSEQSICWSIYCKAKIETQLIHELLDKSSVTRFQNKLKRFFTHVSFPVKRVESTKTCHV